MSVVHQGMVELIPHEAYEGIKHLVEPDETLGAGATEPVQIGPWIALQNLLRQTQPARPGE